MTCKMLWSHKETNGYSTECWPKFYHQSSQELGEYMLLYVIGQKLKEQQSKYVQADKEIYIEFEREEYYSMFVLRWSL